MINYRLKNPQNQPRIILRAQCSIDSFLNVNDNHGHQVPVGSPKYHRENNAESSIQAFKNQFIVLLCRVDKDFHLKLWDRLLHQEKISLNILILSRIHPHLSDYTHIFGEFSYNRTPLFPPGTRIVTHNMPNYKASWSIYGKFVWYVVPAMELYRLYKAYIPKTRA